MKKIGLILIIAIGAGLAALPYINGLIMEKLALQSLENANLIYADTGADLKFEVVSYDRGYAGTQAEWRIDLGSFEHVYGVKEIIFVERAKHGFVSVRSETDLGKNLWFSQWVEDQGSNPLSITTEYSVYRPIQTRITLDEILVETKEEPLNVGALDLMVSIDKELKYISSKGKWEGFSENENNRLGPMKFESSQERISSLVWEGKAELILDNFVARENGEDIEASDIVFSFDLKADKDRANMDMEMGFKGDDIHFNGQDLSDWSLALEIHNMDIQAYETLYRQYSNLVNRTLAQLSVPDISDEQMEALFSQAMIQSRSQLIAGVEKMLKKDLEIQVSDLKMTLPQGEVKGSLSLGLKRDITLAGFLPLAVQPSLALEIFSLDSRFSFPMVLAKGNPGLTTPLLPGMKTGFFIVKGSQLDHKAKIRENRLYLNGEEVVLE